MSASGPKRTCLVAPHMSAFGGAADIRVSSVGCANKIRYFLNCLLPRKWRWEAHGEHNGKPPERFESGAQYVET
jgi:hypothetical protein